MSPPESSAPELPVSASSAPEAPAGGARPTGGPASVPDAPTPAFDRAELLPAIVQDARTGQVLMLGYMNRESYARTLDEGVAWFFSRSRGRLWKKGETSGNVLQVRAVKLDCDGDTILVQADPVGPTCHTNAQSCFFTTVQQRDGAPPSAESAAELWQTIKGRFAERPEGSYIAKLAEGGTERIAKKVGEEAVEVAIAAMKGSRDELTYETADLFFHAYVLLAQAGLTPDDVWAELARRRK